MNEKRRDEKKCPSSSSQDMTVTFQLFVANLNLARVEAAQKVNQRGQTCPGCPRWTIYITQHHLKRMKINVK